MVQHTATLLLACLMGSAAAGSIPSDNTSVDKRSSVQVSDDGRLHCGIFGSGSKDNLGNMEMELSRGKLAERKYNIGAGECNRVHCDATTGIYVCNDGTASITLDGSWIGKGVKCIFDHCCKDEFSGLKRNTGISGQRFYNAMGLNFNIVVAYGNCGDPANIRPNNALGWGVNPVCMGGVEVPSLVMCDP